MRTLETGGQGDDAGTIANLSLSSCPLPSLPPSSSLFVLEIISYLL